MNKITNNIKYCILLCIVGLLLLPACNDDFMQQDPIVDLSEGAFLKNEGDLPFFLNQLYDRYLIGHGRGWSDDRRYPFDIIGSPILHNDLRSDNMVHTGGANARMNGTFNTPQSGNSGWDWGNLRRVNYFLRNYHQAEGSVNDPAALNKWAAEARFFKAWDYFEKVKLFGDVPWYTYDMNIDSPELYAPRTPRKEVMDSVLWTINYSVEHIQDNGRVPTGRINQDMALFLKAHIALYEGTFRKYHTDLGLTDWRRWLEECIDACEKIIAKDRYELYNAGTDPYWRLFTFKQDPSTDGNREAILAREYNGTQVGHATQRYHVQNAARYSKGATRSLVDEYLMEDGQPIYTGGTPGNFVTNPLFQGYDGMWAELNNRDNRLRQTVARPGEFMTIASIADGGLMSRDRFGITYPPIVFSGAGSTVTGYWVIKHFMGDPVEYDAVTQGRQTAIMFRYAEVLLMLAEAKAELGILTDADLDRTVNKLRERAGFDFTKYPNAKLSMGNIPADPRLDAIYAEKLDYTVSPILREIRRERRVELAIEGRRYDDLMRWKAGNLLTVPLRGMKFTAEKQKLYDGSNAQGTGTGANRITAQQARIGNDVFVDQDGFLIAYPRDVNVNMGTLPWSDYRYYWPIPIDQLTLNENLKQNPGWRAN
ncbi:MAG: RagB/SusD family nutrient uptake outer membrane protein [Dysgonamonadaceae bacterium]|jgi:hypothetical protein|nr:RagB/SusD family nutrient uptake outer membrane protein [Dysgonamonadaceae bacterium]